MPSPENISELVIWSTIAAVFVISVYILFRISPAGRRARKHERVFDADRIVQQAAEQAKEQPQENYRDPISAAAVRNSLIAIAFFAALAFAYYFITKGGFLAGN